MSMAVAEVGRLQRVILAVAALSACARTELDPAPVGIQPVAANGDAARNLDSGALDSAARAPSFDGGSRTDALRDIPAPVSDAIDSLSAVNFCVQLTDNACDRAFACTAPADRGESFTLTFGATIDGCKQLLRTPRCDRFEESCPRFDPTLGATCIRLSSAETCAEYTALPSFWPDDCDLACNM